MHITEFCCDDVYHGNFEATFVQNDVVQVEKCVKFLEYLFTTKCDDGFWEMGASWVCWDGEVLHALSEYDK